MGERHMLCMHKDLGSVSPGNAQVAELCKTLA